MLFMPLLAMSQWILSAWHVVLPRVERQVEIYVFVYGRHTMTREKDRSQQIVPNSHSQIVLQSGRCAM